MGNISEKMAEKIKKHILCLKLFSENCDGYETKWKNHGRVRQVTVDSMAHAHYMLDT